MRIPGELIPIVLFTMIPITAIGVPIARAIARRIEGDVNITMHGASLGTPRWYRRSSARAGARDWYRCRCANGLSPED